MNFIFTTLLSWEVIILEVHGRLMTLSSTGPTFLTPWKMFLINIASAIYFTAVCAAQDLPDGVSLTDPPPTLASVPTVYDIPVPSVQIRSTWSEVFPSEKVEFYCSVNGSSDWTFTWSRNGKDAQDSDPNLSLSADGSILQITAETQLYSGNYSCQAHHKTKKVTTVNSAPPLYVFANQPKLTLSRSNKFDKMYLGESVTFNCTVHESFGWEYLWFHDGKKIQAHNNKYTIPSIDHSHSGQYHCQAKRGKVPFYTEESGTTTLQVIDPPKPSLRLQTDWMDVFENETVEIICDVNNPEWTFSWYKNYEELQEDDVLTLDAEQPLLNITAITKDYEGFYTCKAHLESRSVSTAFSNKIKVMVYDNVPKPTLSKHPAINQMYAGEIVNFTCDINVSSGWKYHWFKDGEHLRETSKTISIHLSPSDGGIYSCSGVRGQKTYTEFSTEIQQVVLAIPVPSLKEETPWLDFVLSESVELRCGMDQISDWIYMWYKDGQKIQANNLLYSGLNGEVISIGSASPAHAGQYSCSGYLKERSVSSNSSSGLNLSVYDTEPTVTLMQDPDYQLMFIGESVTFSCHMDLSSDWEYLWYKDSEILAASGNTLTVSIVGTTNQGSYYCLAKRGKSKTFVSPKSRITHLDVEKKRPKPSITFQPNADTVYIGESVSFRCRVELSSGWEYFWFKDGAAIFNNSDYFSIHNANLWDSGTYKCMARRNKTIYETRQSNGQSLLISEKPVPLLVPITTWLDVFPTESVELSCTMDKSSDWKYTWFKDGQQVHRSNSVAFDSDAATLSINSVSTSHHGRYSCSGKLKHRSVVSDSSSGLTLSVYDSKPRVVLMQNPSHNVMYTGESVSFSCHINVSSGWEYLWYKDDSSLDETGDKYTIPSVLTQHTGSFKCQLKRGSKAFLFSDKSKAVQLDIKERPKAEIILKTGWSEVFSTDTLVLECGVEESQFTWNYTWLKQEQPINLSLSERHTVTPQDDPEQSSYTCRGIRNERPTYSKTSEPYKTKNLLLKRRVLLSISGFIFFGIIAVFIGCVLLRVNRKPADEDFKPEDVDLFLSMDQIKGRDDVNCPLFQYITDAEVNASPKGGDENLPTDNETTSLPMTSMDDQADKDEITVSHGSAENGGLVSFKQ